MAAKANKKKMSASQSTTEKRRKKLAQIPPARDIAAQKQVEERLAHLASFPEHNPNPLTEVDLAGHFHYLNPASKQLFPDLQTRGLKHPWLKDLKAIGALLAEKGKGSHARELKIGESWYHQSIHFMSEERRLRIYGFNITARKQAEEAQRSSEERYRGLYEAISGGVMVQDQEGTILGANAAACDILGLTQDEIQARTMQDPRWRAMREDGSPLPNDDRPSRRALRTGIAVQGQVMGVFNPSLEQYRWLLVNAEPILDPKTSQVQAVVSTFLDITNRKKREEELRKLNRTLTALSNSSKAMMRATNESEYLKEVCKIVVEDCGHKMVWIGFAEEDEGKTVRPVAHAGFEEGYLETLRITWADTERGRGPTGTAIRTGKVSMCRNMLTDPHFAPWREQAIKRGYASSIVLPLLAENKAFGALNIYSKEPDPFSADEVKLLSELADDLAYGITALRLRAAHAQAEEALRESEERLNRAEEIAHLGSWELDLLSNRLSWSDEVYRIFGLEPQEFGATYEAFLEAVHPDDRAAVDDAYAGSLREGRDTYEIEHRVVRESNGEVRNVHEKCEHIRDATGHIIRSVGMVHDITERKGAEEAVLRAKEEWERTFDAVPDLVTILDNDYRIVRVNKAMADRLHLTSEQCIGLKCYEAVHGGSQPAAFCPHTLTCQSGQEHIAEIREPRLGGEFLVSTTPLCDAQGKLIGSVHVARDITERKQAEEALRKAHDELEIRVQERTVELKGVVEALQDEMTERRQAEEALKGASLYTRSLIEASLDPLVTISAEGKVTDVNKATELITGVSRDQLIGSDFTGYFAEPDKARTGYRKVFSEGSVRDYPLAIRHISGLTTDVLYNATVYENDNGEVQGVFAAARDITAQKSAEEERLRLIAAIEQSNESIVITDDAGDILYFNPAFGHINDYLPGEAMGKNYFDILQGDDRDKGFKKKLADILSKGRIWEDHLIRKKKGGTSYELDVTISPVREQSGKIINYSIIERDVTHEAILEQHLRQQQKMEALGTLAGGIAHDFNNILMPIMINTELSLYDMPEESPINQYLKTVLQAAQRGQELVKQIIAFSRQKEQELSPIRITPLVKETLKFLRAAMPQEIEIRENFDVESGMIMADPTQIYQVVMNLCSNAVHAMREKGGVLEVSLADVEVDAHMLASNPDLKPGSYLKLTVSDTGHGMDQELIKRIFEPFFTTKKPGEGTGMGLAVVHGIVKRHEGAITTDSEPGKGATFHVFFPRIQGHVEQEALTLDAIPTGDERILLVDDEEVQVRSGRYLLERLGYTVTTTTKSLEALEVFRAQPEAFNLVITDQSMPRLTGVQLAEQLMQIRADIPIILCTGFSDMIDGKEAKAMGIQEFMMKPFSARQLAETIRRILGERD
jgi:PAS domain S-box-containing protein